MTDTDNTMEALQKIKEELSLRYLSQTPEERKRDAREDKEWFEKMTGKPVRTADHSRRRVADEEPAQV